MNLKKELLYSSDFPPFKKKQKTKKTQTVVECFHEYTILINTVYINHAYAHSHLSSLQKCYIYKIFTLTDSDVCSQHYGKCVKMIYSEEKKDK